MNQVNHKSTRVLARNINTGSILKFDSAVHCSYYFDVNYCDLRSHLMSHWVGRVTYEWYAFKLDDGKAWPIMLEDECVEMAWVHTGLVTAKNLKTQEVQCFNTLKEAATAIGANVQYLRRWQGKYGEEKPYRGWVVKDHDHALIIDETRRNKMPNSAYRSFRLVDLKTGEGQLYRSTKAIAKDLDMSPDMVRYHIRKKKLLKDGQYQIVIVYR
jgi:hypothetical protein